VAAHAKLVAACPDGKDDEVGSGTSGWSTGRWRSIATFSTSTKPELAKYAITTSGKMIGRRWTSAAITASANQTMP